MKHSLWPQHTHTHTRGAHTHVLFYCVSLTPVSSVLPLTISYSTTQPWSQGHGRRNDPPGSRATISTRRSVPLFTVLGFINSALYFLYCSAAAALFITARDRCLEAGDKHRHTLNKQLEQEDGWAEYLEVRRASQINFLCFVLFFWKACRLESHTHKKRNLMRNLVVFLFFMPGKKIYAAKGMKQMK